jgi:hypothetical protein
LSALKDYTEATKKDPWITLFHIFQHTSLHSTRYPAHMVVDSYIHMINFFSKKHCGLVDRPVRARGNTEVGRMWYAIIPTIHGTSLLLMYKIAGEDLT